MFWRENMLSDDNEYTDMLAWLVSLLFTSETQILSIWDLPLIWQGKREVIETTIRFGSHVDVHYETTEIVFQSNEFVRLRELEKGIKAAN